MIDPTKAADRWSSGLANAGTKYRDGVNGFQGNPMELAAANKQGWLNGIQEAAANGKWERGLRRNPASYWKEQCSNIGAQRLATGATKGKPKWQAFATQFFPFLQQVTDRVRAMPASTYEERKARAVAQMDGVHQFIRS